MHSYAWLQRPPATGNPDQRYIDTNFYWVQMMARLRPGVTLAQAQAALAGIFQPFVAGTAVNDKGAVRSSDSLFAGGRGRARFCGGVIRSRCMY